MSDRPQITPGERFADIDEWDHQRVKPPHIWATLGYRRLSWEPGATEIAWDATENYCFPTAGGPVVDKRRLEVGSPIKTLGAHKVTVRLHPEVEAVLDLEVVAA